MTTSGNALCWGGDYSGQATPPAGESFASISAGGGHTCGVTTSGDTLCWGNDEDGRATPPAGVAFASFSAGGQHTCGVTTSGDTLCWADKIANPRIEYGVAMTKRVRLGFRVKGIVPESLSAAGHTELFDRWLRRMTSGGIKSKIHAKRCNGTRSSRRDPNPAMRFSMSNEEVAQWRYPRR